MDENKKAMLQAAGIDVEEALERFLGNEALMMKFLLRFPEDENFHHFKQAMVQSDVQAAFEAAHTLKGVVGNLSMKEFFHQVSDLVEDLRMGNLGAAENKIPVLEDTYCQMIAILNQLG